MIEQKSNILTLIDHRTLEYREPKIGQGQDKYETKIPCLGKVIQPHLSPKATKLMRFYIDTSQSNGKHPKSHHCNDSKRS